MRMILYAANSYRDYLLVAADTSDIGPQFGLDLCRDTPKAVLGAEDGMHVALRKGVRHLSPLPGLYILLRLPSAHALGYIMPRLRRCATLFKQCRPVPGFSVWFFPRLTRQLSLRTMK